MKRVELNIELLDKELKMRGMSQRKFSELIGKSGAYISSIKLSKEVPKNVESLMCKMLEKPEGYFLKNTEHPAGGGIERS